MAVEINCKWLDIVFDGKQSNPIFSLTHQRGVDRNFAPCENWDFRILKYSTDCFCRPPRLDLPELSKPVRGIIRSTYTNFHHRFELLLRFGRAKNPNLKACDHPTITQFFSHFFRNWDIILQNPLKCGKPLLNGSIKSKQATPMWNPACKIAESGLAKAAIQKHLAYHGNWCLKTLNNQAKGLQIFFVE